MSSLVEVAQGWWSGYICDLSHLFISFLFSCFCFLRHAPESQFLTDRDDLYAIACFQPTMYLLGSRQYPTTFRGKPKNLPKMGGNRHFAAKSAKSEIYRSPMKIFHRHINYRDAIKHIKSTSNGVLKGPRGILLEFLDSLYISGTVELETSYLAHRLATGIEVH